MKSSAEIPRLSTKQTSPSLSWMMSSSAMTLKWRFFNLNSHKQSKRLCLTWRRRELAEYRKRTEYSFESTVSEKRTH